MAYSHPKTSLFEKILHILIKCVTFRQNVPLFERKNVAFELGSSALAVEALIFAPGIHSRLAGCDKHAGFSVRRPAATYPLITNPLIYV